MTLRELAADLAAKRRTSVDLVRGCLARIEDPAGEGKATFVKVHAAQALAAAEAIDALRRAGLAPSPFAGIPISVKDLFDLAGDVTSAGSKALADAAPAGRDAPAIARLRAAGFIVLGRTNMTEFAFSGLGLNPHYGTPRNPYDRELGRIPGGSSSGAAISVTDDMAYAAIGTDTGGSCRVPAALCGLVGYKPTARSVPKSGVVPLSFTLDSVGPIARSVACCRILHDIMSGAGITDRNVGGDGVAGLRIAVPQTLVLDGVEPYVATLFEQALARLSAAGARIEPIDLPEFAEIAAINGKGGFGAAEAYAWHRRLLGEKAALYDPRILGRILRGREQDAADYIELTEKRAAFIAGVEKRMAGFDLLAMPTVPIVAPTIADVDADDATFSRINLLMLRNSSAINLMDGCAISLPMHELGKFPAGLMLAARGGADDELLRHAAAAEPIVAQS